MAGDNVIQNEVMRLVEVETRPGFEYGHFKFRTWTEHFKSDFQKVVCVFGVEGQGKSALLNTLRSSFFGAHLGGPHGSEAKTGIADKAVTHHITPWPCWKWTPDKGKEDALLCFLDTPGVRAGAQILASIIRELERILVLPFHKKKPDYPWYGVTDYNRSRCSPIRLFTWLKWGFFGVRADALILVYPLEGTKQEFLDFRNLFKGVRSAFDHTYDDRVVVVLTKPSKLFKVDLETNRFEHFLMAEVPVPPDLEYCTGCLPPPADEDGGKMYPPCHGIPQNLPREFRKRHLQKVKNWLLMTVSSVGHDAIFTIENFHTNSDPFARRWDHRFGHDPDPRAIADTLLEAYSLLNTLVKMRSLPGPGFSVFGRLCLIFFLGLIIYVVFHHAHYCDLLHDFLLLHLQ